MLSVATHPILWPRASFKSNQNNFGIRSDAHGWSPRPRPISRINLQGAQAAQAVSKLSVNSFYEQIKRKELPAMRMPRKLQ